MGLLSALLDHDLVVYILTLGVLEGFRHQGIAAALIRMSCHQALTMRCGGTEGAGGGVGIGSIEYQL